MLNVEDVMKSKSKRSNPAEIAAYGCTRCANRYVVTGEVVANPILCVCGASLEPKPLVRGVYALKSGASEDVRATFPGREAAAASASEEPTAPREAKAPIIPTAEDLGYGASHGNAPGHEGPTGPGDTPA